MAFEKLIDTTIKEERNKAIYITCIINKILNQPFIENSQISQINKLIENNGILKWPFLQVELTNTFVKNITKLEQHDNIKRFINSLFSTSGAFNRIKILRADSKKHFEACRRLVFKNTMNNNENLNILLTNALTAKKNLVEDCDEYCQYISDEISNLNIKFGNNDEKILSTIVVLEEEFSIEFIKKLLIKTIEKENYLLSLILLKYNNNSKKLAPTILKNTFSEKSIIIRNFLNSYENKRKNKIQPNKEKPNLSLCISGQLRGYKKTLPKILSELTKYFNVYTFLSTWDTIGCREPYPLSSSDRVFDGLFLESFKSIFSNGHITWEEFKKSYPGILNLVHGENKPDIQFLESTFATCEGFEIKIHEEEKHIAKSNQEKMYFMINDSFILSKDYSTNHGVIFDFNMRIRPDRELVINAPHLIETINNINDEIYTDNPINLHYFKGLVVGDCLAFGRPKTMEYYSNFINYKSRNIRAHNDLALYLLEQNISTKQSSFKLGRYENPSINREKIKKSLENDSKNRCFHLDKTLINSINHDIENINEKTNN